MYPSLVVSNFFINKSIEEGVELTLMKLLKLVYITHGWFLGYNDRPLIQEPVKAWRYGPVIDSVYRAIKKFGRGQIKSFIDIYNDGIINPNEYQLDEKIGEFCTVVWNHYKDKDGLQLSALTHTPNTPWGITIKNSGVNSIIPNNLIKEYYKKIINESTPA